MRFSLGIAMTVWLAPALAFAWSQSALFDVTVHQHEFERVAVESEGCSLRARFYFKAPAEAYTSASKYFRFKARIRLDAGHDVTTPIFGNRGPGARVYSFTHDTSSEGCWAKLDHKFTGFDVEGCQGRKCTPDPFKL